MSWVDKCREELSDVIRRKIYLNNASSGPPPKSVFEAVKSLMDHWDTVGEPWDYALDKILEAKRLFAELVRVSEDEVAYIPGVSYGFNILLSSLDPPRDSNIVVSELNFPTAITMAKAMERNGLIKEVRIVKDRGGYTDVSDYERLIDDNTSIVIVDYVSWLSGYIEDIKFISELAHKRDALVISDMFHAIGAIPVNLRDLEVDIAFTGSYKWLMGLHGAGFMYIKRELLERVYPRYAGWLGIDDSVFQRRLRGEEEFKRPFNIYNFKYPSTANRFELGTPPLTAFIALYEALKFHLRYGGPEKYYRHTRELSERLYEGIQDIGLEMYSHHEKHSPIVTFRYRDPHGLASKLLNENIEVSARPGLIRVSPHFYNTFDEIEKLIDALNRLA